ncbi:MAG: toll/interleukin-1 receptor domain-containing protein [Ktedonobacteraceae bacterium]
MNEKSSCPVLRGRDGGNTVLLLDNLRETIFYLADLSFADLREADLGAADFSYANLIGTDLSGTTIGWTSFGDRDLREIKGLETIRHGAPSPLSINTIYLSEGEIPEAFVRGTGAPDTFLDYMHSLVGKPIEYYSCFISYSSKDDAFARRLYADLQSNNVRCWFAPEDLKWGERIRSGIDEAIRLHDKLLLILSRHSVASGWVEREVKTALAKERKETRTVLFPVRVDNAVLECPYAWATEIRHERNMGNFTKWKNHDEYQKAFTRLLRDLKAEAKKTEEP